MDLTLDFKNRALRSRCDTSVLAGRICVAGHGVEANIGHWRLKECWERSDAYAPFLFIGGS